MANPALPSILMIAPYPYWTGAAGTVRGTGTSYSADSLGRFTCSSVDVNDLEAQGCYPSNSTHRTYSYAAAPVAAGATAVAGSTTQTMVAGATITIAAQPDVPRQLQVVATPGGSTFTLTAGSLILTYIANDSTTQVDTLNFGANASPSAQTLTTSKGVLKLTSAIVGPTVTNVASGTTTLSIGTNNYLAVPLDPGAINVAFIKETKVTPTNGTLGLAVPADETVSTLTVSTGLISPTTAPDGTHNFGFDYTYQWP